MMCAAIGAGVYGLALKGVDHFSLALYAMAGVVSLHYLHISSNTAYTDDISGHLNYISFINQHWFSPYSYAGEEHWQPPVYYYIAAAVIRLTTLLGTIPSLTGLRFLSWLFYLVFNAFSLLCLRQAGLRGSIYKTAVALLLLWPVSLHGTTKISNEPLFYALYAASFYYTVVWYQGGQERQLMRALVLAGIACTVRINTFLLLGVISILVGIACYRGRFSLRSLWSVQWTATAGWLALCLLIPFSRIMWHPMLLFYIPDGITKTPINEFTLSHFFVLYFQYSLTHPYNDWSENQSFLDFVIKTSIFGQYSNWPETIPWLALSALLYLFLLLIILYTVITLLTARRAALSSRMPFFVGLIFPASILLAYAVWRGSQCEQNVRFIYPALCCFIVWFGSSVEILRSRQLPLLAIAGPICAWSFAAISLIFFWNVGR